MFEGLYTERAAILREEYPALWDEETGSFGGAISTNAIEGDNRRLKYGLQMPYVRVPLRTARTDLLALHDSMYVSRNGALT